MKEFFTGVLVTAPITAFIVQLALSGRQEVTTTQERHYVDQQLATQVFDQQFEDAWNTAKLSDHGGNRAERIRRLEKRKAQFDQEFDRQFATSQQDVSELRQALSEVPSEQTRQTNTSEKTRLSTQ